jgi:predicted phosphodiesterase
VIRLFQEVAPTIAVRGNVDDGCDEEAFPYQRILTIQGWVMLVTHVVRQPQSAVRLMQFRSLIDIQHA